MPTAGDHHVQRSTQPVHVLLSTKSLGRGGAERLLVDRVATADRSGFEYEVAYILDSEDGSFRPSNPQARPSIDSEPSTTSTCAGCQPSRVCRHFDIVHFHLPYSAALGRPMVFSIPRRRRPITLYTEHSLWNKVSPLVKVPNRATIPVDRAVIAVSQAAHDAMPGLVKRRATVVVHGVDLSPSNELVAMRGENRKAIRAELGVREGELLAVTVANLRSEKGYDVLLECASLVKAQTSHRARRSRRWVTGGRVGQQASGAWSPNSVTPRLRRQCVVRRGQGSVPKIEQLYFAILSH